MKTLILLFVITLFTIIKAFSQKNPNEVPLYEGKIPNEIPGPNEEETTNRDNVLRIGKVRNPTLTAFLPPKDKANGTAVIICPGGGYSILAFQHEGSDVAKKLNEQGIAAFVLKYRLPSSKTSSRPELAPLQDAQQAIRVVRSKAKEYNINPSRIGIMGFSAGGHLASTAGTHFLKPVIPNPENTSVRPDFMLLLYPVISSHPQLAHGGSFKNLLGENPSPEKLKDYSNDLQVSVQTPPTFLVHASDDKGVKPDNSILFYQALLKNNVPAELHIYQGGGHGFGLHNKTTSDSWFERCMNWLRGNGFLK